jgi:hypothetical protein
MNRLLIVGILIISTAPLFAQAQRPDAAKLKSDAQFEHRPIAKTTHEGRGAADRQQYHQAAGVIAEAMEFSPLPAAVVCRRTQRRLLHREGQRRAEARLCLFRG